MMFLFVCFLFQCKYELIKVLTAQWQPGNTLLGNSYFPSLINIDMS